MRGTKGLIVFSSYFWFLVVEARFIGRLFFRIWLPTFAEATAGQVGWGVFEMIDKDRHKGTKARLKPDFATLNIAQLRHKGGRPSCSPPAADFASLNLWPEIVEQAKVESRKMNWDRPSPEAMARQDRLGRARRRFTARKLPQKKIYNLSRIYLHR